MSGIELEVKALNEVFETGQIQVLKRLLNVMSDGHGRLSYDMMSLASKLESSFLRQTLGFLEERFATFKRMLEELKYIRNEVSIPTR
jgi:hypothetical protein